MMPDTYSRGATTQWFMFEVSNVRRGIVYRLSLANFAKKDSLSRVGMRPLEYSTHRAATDGSGWRRVGARIRYYKVGARGTAGTRAEPAAHAEPRRDAARARARARVAERTRPIATRLIDHTAVAHAAERRRRRRRRRKQRDPPQT